MSSSFSYAKSALMLMESTANLRAWLVTSIYYIILDTLNLALYLLKALALPNPGTCMWAFCFGFSCQSSNVLLLVLGHAIRRPYIFLEIKFLNNDNYFYLKRDK